MKLETIVKVTSDGGVEIPSDTEVGNGLMNMVKELREMDGGHLSITIIGLKTKIIQIQHLSNNLIQETLIKKC